MTTYAEIRQLAVQLPLEEQIRLAEDILHTLVDALASQRWDDQIEADVQAGKLDALADAVLADCDLHPPSKMRSNSDSSTSPWINVSPMISTARSTDGGTWAGVTR